MGAHRSDQLSAGWPRGRRGRPTGLGGVEGQDRAIVGARRAVLEGRLPEVVREGEA